jgi:hypothetical protein
LVGQLPHPALHSLSCCLMHSDSSFFGVVGSQFNLALRAHARD